MTDKMLVTMATAVVTSIALALPAVAGAQDEGAGGDVPVTDAPSGEPGPQPARLSVRVKVLQSGRRPALSRTTAVGTLSPFVPGQRVRVGFVRGGKVVAGRRVRVHRAAGAEHGPFRLRSPRLVEPGG